MIPTRTISEFVVALAQESNLPFAADIGPDTDWQPLKKEVVGKLEIPLFGELLALEQWFFEGIAAKATARGMEMQMAVNALLRSVKQEFNIASTKEARPILQRILGGEQPQPEPETTKKKGGALAVVVKDEQLEEFTFQYQDQFNKLLVLSAQSAGQSVERIFKVTFFLRQRVDANWDFANTAKLRQSEIEKINELISIEMAGATIAALATEPVTEGESSANQPSQTGLDSTPTLELAA